jgi:hypothetical protein
MSENEVPAKVFSGLPTEALFLKSLLESAGIQTNLTGPFFGAAGDIYVRRNDADHALEVIEDFQRNGKRTDVASKPADVLKGRWQA